MIARRARTGWPAAVAMLALALPGSATGAVTVGDTRIPTDACLAGFSILQTTSPGNQYVAPSDGVLTSWSYRTGPNPLTLVFKVGRPAGGIDFTVVAESELETLGANRLNTYQSRFPVERGDVIGLYLASSGECSRGDSAYGSRQQLGEVALGSTAEFGDMESGYQYGVSARLEPDCDNDGFGDETQDQSIEGCTPPTASDTTPPEVEITKGAPNKLDKSKVKFKFVSDDPTASFECKLKGKGVKSKLKRFSECTSPRKYKRLDEGKHKFKVRAIDPAGNVGAPAKDKFKVVD